MVPHEMKELPLPGGVVVTVFEISLIKMKLLMIFF